MDNALTLDRKPLTAANILFDLLAVAFVYFLPAISHLLSVPVYLADPMRIVILLAVIHTSFRNSYLIALTLPLFSFLIASHPVAIKSLLISAELLLNIYLFYKLSDYLKNSFTLMFVSILISKIFYYAVKYLLLSSTLLEGELVSTSLYIQLIVMVIISGYYFFMKNNKKI